MDSWNELVGRGCPPSGSGFLRFAQSLQLSGSKGDAVTPTEEKEHVRRAVQNTSPSLPAEVRGKSRNDCSGVVASLTAAAARLSAPLAFKAVLADLARTLAVGPLHVQDAAPL